MAELGGVNRHLSSEGTLSRCPEFARFTFGEILVFGAYGLFEFEFQIFVQRQVWVMGFQELCLLCYETQWLRHSQVGRVAQSLLWPPATV